MKNKWTPLLHSVIIISYIVTPQYSGFTDNAKACSHPLTEYSTGMVNQTFVNLSLNTDNPAISGTDPIVSIAGTNSNTIKKYEKFELTLSLQNVSIQNPYDPDDIDVYSLFISPDGSTTRVNGFYDNYRNSDAWKLRFSPNRTGEWSYQVFVKNAGSTGHSGKASFIVIGSDHHGWIRPSVKDSHYFTYDDGTSYYAVAVYSPWGNTEKRFKTYADHKASLLALWDINYGGFVDGSGLIEEKLGKYNQEKCGRMDSLLFILEASDIKLMFAIWPHDLFSKTVWEAQWNENPYSKIVDVADVYSDSLTWEYQKKKYRYLIARFAYSRSWGIWELINEMNGTDGWTKGSHQAAYDWVEKADKFFAENDPYKHPLTASFSGGFDEYRTPLYERTDIPNLHLYEAQGWPLKYPGDTLRSSMYNYAWASQRFWNNFNKPAIFGEAGADLTWYRPSTPKYHEAYHNAIWASLSNGLAGTPVWWDFTLLSDRDWDHLGYLSDFVSNIDFANVVYTPAVITGDGIDAFAMMSNESGFGWACSYKDADISENALNIKIPDGSYQIIWYDTWTGNDVRTDKATSINGLLMVPVPKLSVARKDIAFKIQREK